MAKAVKKSKKQTKVKATPPPKSFVISSGVQDAIFIGLIFFILLFLLKPLVIDHLSPQGVDVIGGIGKTHQISEYQKETGERALWNPYIFGGMPVYHRISARAFSVDNLLAWISRLFHIVFIYYFFGGLGFYLLLHYLKMQPLIAFIGALLFIFMPHYKSLYLVGHLAKFKALMILPWILLSFQYFLDRRSLLAAALFALAFGTQIRTEHYQIVFYSALLVFAVGVWPLLKDIVDKNYTQFIKSISLLVMALILAITMSAQPLFLAKEYLPWSKRGKTAIDLNKPKSAQQETGGASLQYATQWSTAPSEMLTWLVPRFYGGMSNEKYDGSQYRRLRGRDIPAYWGHMPFTQSYEYMGLLTLLLAALGFITHRKKSAIISLMIFAAFLILLSFGRHFESFYALFYDYVPFFNKFRAPMMSVTVTYFIFALFAAYGLKALNELKIKKRLPENKQLIYLFGGFAVVGLFMWLIGAGASFTKPGGEPYQGQTLEMIRNIRSEYLNADMLRYFIILLAAGTGITAYLMKKINFTVVALLLGLIAVGDLLQVQGRVHKDFKNVKRLERQYFTQTATDQFLAKDKEIYRILPTGKMFADNRWAYYHQTIGGYTPIKMYAIEELVENNIYNGWDKKLPFNWNVLKIMNVKYVLLNQPVSNEYLLPVHSDRAKNIYTYLFRNNLPRAFFVGKYRVVQDEYARLKAINSREFDPATEAILEEKLEQKIEVPDSSFARVVSFSPNRVEFDVYTDKQSLLVISEMYYPPGWKLFVDQQREDKIYRADHAIQAAVIPAGRHKIELRFEPDSYFRDKKMAMASVGILYLLILGSLGSLFFRRSKKA